MVPWQAVIGSKSNEELEGKNMEQITIASRIIDTIHFTQEDGRLRVCFVNGAERTFTGVPSDIVREMASSASPGDYYLQNVRNCYRRAA